MRFARLAMSPWRATVLVAAGAFFVLVWLFLRGLSEWGGAGSGHVIAYQQASDWSGISAAPQRADDARALDRTDQKPQVVFERASTKSAMNAMSSISARMLMHRIHTRARAAATAPNPKQRNALVIPNQMLVQLEVMNVRRPRAAAPSATLLLNRRSSHQPGMALAYTTLKPNASAGTCSGGSESREKNVGDIVLGVEHHLHVRIAKPAQ